jgi:hypothetical protein
MANPAARILSAHIELLPLRTPAPDPLRLSLHHRAATTSDYLTAPPAVAPGADLVAVLTLAPIGSADTLQVEQATLTDHHLHLHLSLRHFEGRLAASVPRLALAVVDLSTLAPGHYDLDLLLDRYVFTRYDHPESATRERSESHRLALDL